MVPGQEPVSVREEREKNPGSGLKSQGSYYCQPWHPEHRGGSPATEGQSRTKWCTEPRVGVRVRQDNDRGARDCFGD